MRIFLILVLAACGMVGVIYGLMAFGNATSAVHEIEGLISVLIVSVVAGAAYVGPSRSK